LGLQRKRLKVGRSLQAVLEGVAQGNELDVFVGPERLGGGPGAAAAAADQADAQQVAAGGVHVRGGRQRPGDGGGGLQEITAAGCG
jgi:hypothetical protein